MNSMQKVIGAICLVVGILLLVQGHDMAQSIGSEVKQAFTGAPTERSTYFYIAGIALTIFGVFQMFWHGKHK